MGMLLALQTNDERRPALNVPRRVETATLCLVRGDKFGREGRQVETEGGELGDRLC